LNPRWFPAEGEEAAIVGSFVDLMPHDICAPHYRGPFVVYLMRGAELWRLVAQALGKPAGYNKGRSVPFTGPFERGVVPWVAGDLGSSLGVATGAALALKQSTSGGVCVCTFGDGTSNRGDFHENVNLAATWRLPIVYVCQNNGWAISQRARDYLRAPVAARSSGYGIPGASVDGQDICAVRAAIAEAVATARAGGGPTLVEAVTTRIRGHWGGDDESYRHDDMRSEPVDPLELLGDRLVGRGAAAADELEQIRTAAQLAVAEAIERSQALPDASVADLGLNEVYA
ncbi:MAG: thiamine pyrophosphate-dependent dehydrogenase E1 component subunit alpha, partial [Candidatus Dormiibacterota bacterium]